MDAVISAAGHALARGDVLGALKRVALREDGAALALRGIAMAQLGDLPKARALLKAATRQFAPSEALSRARCQLAEIEIALVSRDLNWPQGRLRGIRETLMRRGDPTNAAHALHIDARRALLLGHADTAEELLDGHPDRALRPALTAARALLRAGIAMRRLRPREARTALAEARIAATASGLAGLVAEVDAASARLEGQSALLRRNGIIERLDVDGIEAVLASPALVIDACRNLVRHAGTSVSFSSRPVLFALLRALGEAWPAPETRDTLLARAFGARFVDESHRARLRVEIGRLRALLGDMAGIEATPEGFVLVADQLDVVVLSPPVEDRHADLLALLADGEAWSSSALALVLDTSARTVQRALDDLSARGKVESFGKGPARRWITPPMPGFPTLLLLPGPLPGS
ncbi:helix-turn-helix domain-containing protein [Devosia sediminis]|uniref:Helix-turn-helix domain-containing protein n=1 Tax=Devosia sediminis TaxID=2798801 RepID=A0A934MJY5_9HYPH|nr:helix-turn-helix domain-containing protein [Devosia sediminis]MBJ3783585.1 helix-turn-helix domain-containing protein [Devosia sediminis]